MHDRWQKVSLASLAVLAFALMATGVKADVILSAGTKVQIVFEQDVSSKYVTPGDLIPIRLYGAVDYGGITAVKDGAKGSARVKSVKPAGKGGKPGRVEVVLVELEPNGSYKAEGDKKIALKAIDDPITAEGKGRKTLSYLFIFGLFIKGTEGVIPADEPFPAEIAEEIVILITE
jgi:hypothetical protein